jgi:RNA polymerase sigma-70 factor (ECF subfamily)
MEPSESGEWLTTSTVLQRLSNFGDDEAWERFSERFWAPIEKFARRQGLTQSDAEDVAQETLLAFAESYRRGQYDRTQGRLSKWLFGIAWRRVDHVRRKRYRAVTERPVAEDASQFWAQVPDENAASAAWDEVWERALLEAALRKVRDEVQPSTFRVFEAIVLEKRSVEEAMEELGLSRNAVYVAKHRMLSRLRTLMAEADGAE